MKLIITEQQYRLMNEDVEVSNLLDLTSIYKDFPSNKWDKIFLMTKKSDKINYDGYYINDDVFIENGPKSYEYLVKVGGDLIIVNSNETESLPSLKEVTGELGIDGTSIKELPSLEVIGKSLLVRGDVLESLPNLISVGEKCNLWDTKINNLDSLRTVGRSLSLGYSKLNSLHNLEYVGESLNLESSEIVSIPKLKYVGGDLMATNSFISNLDSLEEVDGSLELKYTDIESLPNLKRVGYSMDIRESPMGERLRNEMTRMEIKNKYDVEFGVYI